MSKLNKISIREKVLHNKFLLWLYGQEQDFNNGRAFFGKFTSLSNEFTLAIVFFTHVVGIDLSKNVGLAIKWTIIVMLFVYLFGKIYRKLNILEVDQRASAMRSPINKIQLEAAEIIIARFGKDKDSLIK